MRTVLVATVHHPASGRLQPAGGLRTSSPDRAVQTLAESVAGDGPTGRGQRRPVVGLGGPTPGRLVA